MDEEADHEGEGVVGGEPHGGMLGGPEAHGEEPRLLLRRLRAQPCGRASRARVQAHQAKDLLRYNRSSFLPFSMLCF